MRYYGGDDGMVEEILWLRRAHMRIDVKVHEKNAPIVFG
jgi:hypothetical protein